MALLSLTEADLHHKLHLKKVGEFTCRRRFMALDQNSRKSSQNLERQPVGVSMPFSLVLEFDFLCAVL